MKSETCKCLRDCKNIRRMHQSHLFSFICLITESWARGPLLSSQGVEIMNSPLSEFCRFQIHTIHSSMFIRPFRKGTYGSKKGAQKYDRSKAKLPLIKMLKMHKIRYKFYVPHSCGLPEIADGPWSSSLNFCCFWLIVSLFVLRASFALSAQTQATHE